jgi:N12 class adenine-specific DNA methylase/predicted nucleotidyltransferase
MTDNPKKYLVQVDSYDPKIIDADAFEKKRDDFFQKFPQANVTEISSFEDDGEVGDSDSLLIQVDSYDPKIIDADTYRRKSADFRKAYPDAKISRVKPVDYWGDRLRETDSAIAPLEKRLGEIDDELSSPDIRVGGFRRADAVRLANEKSDIGKQLEGLYADRDNNYLYRKQREAQAKMFEDEDTKLNEMQKQLSDENPDAEKARRASLVGGGAGPLAASAQVFYGKDSDPEFNRDAESLALARIYLDEAKKTAFAPSKGDKSNGFANFFRGLQGAAPESISVVNLIKTGLDMHLVDAIKKIQETAGEDANIFDLVKSPDKLTYLSSAEKELVKAFCIKSAVDADRAGDLSIGYQAGDSAMRSLGFMADFLMFGGEGSLANAAGKKATEGLLKATAKASNRLALKGMARKAALAPAKFGIGTLEAAVKTAVMTPMMPSSWTNLTDNLLSVNDAGQVDLSGKAILNAIGDTFIENLSENAGEQVEAIIDAPFKLAGKAMSKVIPETKFTDWAKIFRNSGASRLMRDAAWHGYFGEIGEEWYGNALRVMTGVDKDALKNFATVDQQLITLISFAPMSVFGMGTSAGQYLSARKGMNKSAERLSALLSQNGYDEAQIKDILDVTKAENPTQLAAKLSPVITQVAEDNATEDSGAQIYRAVCDYAQAVARYRVFDGIHDADVSDQRNAMANELSDRAGLTSIAQTHDAGNGVTYETVRTLTDPDAGPAYVVGEQDGKLAIVQADNGRKYFIPKEQIGENVIDSGEMPLNDFLDREIARKRSASEAERIETDRKQQAQEIFGALNIGDSINVGTEEDPAMGMVIAKQPDGRTVIQLPDGSVNEYTPSEIGNLIGKPISSKTDEQIETEAADAEQEVDDAVRWFRDARYSGEAQGLPFVMADGSTVVINDVRRGESTGSVTATITTSEGQETTTELPAKSVNEAILGNSAVTDETETKDYSTPRDFRGNPLPLKEDGNIDQTALWNNDPEAWAMWNDSVRNDGGENSLAYIETAAGKLKKDIKNIDKEYAKTTDFDKRDSLEGTRKNLQDRLAALDAVRARYAERQNAEAAAKMQAGIERAKEARKAKADELAKYNTESLEGINKKWEDAPKDIGTDDVIVLPNGEEVGGNYVLTEAFAPTPSHDTEKGYAKTEGFPIDENGQTVNDRDYEHDKEAQRQVEQKAASYDQRALQTPVVVSSDGVVLSGNDRTMASQLAARQGTDTKYNEYLAKHPQKYGFTAEQVAKYSNPRVVFVPTESMPYTASTFAKFNAEEKKTQSKTESAVKAGKTITPETVATIAQIIDAHESIAETYADEKAVAAIIRALVDAGTVQENEISRLMDGNLLSGTGEDLVESVLLGAVMREDALRCAMGDKAIRRSIMSALTQLLKNNTYGEYSLSGEFSDAVVLLYQAKHSGLVKGGESIANYMNQPVLEGFGENPLAAATVQMIANTINGTKVNGLKNVLSLYNAKAEMAASGQADLFLGDVETKEQIIREILNEYGYDTETFTGEQQQSTAAAAEQPEQQPEQSEQGSSEEQAPDAVSGDAGSSNEITPEQSPLPGQPNSDQYPTERESSDSKSTQSSETKQENAEISEGRSIQGLEGYSREQIKGIVSDHIRETLSDAGINAEIVGVEIHGSRNRGNAREDSDLDIVVEYRGDIREDDMFNTLNDAENQLIIDGIKVDINPIRAEETGTLQDYMKRSKEYDQNKAEEEPQPEAKNEGQFGLVSDERMAELKKRLLEKIKGQLNSGFDPELLSIGMEMAAGYIDRGIKTFVDFSKAMIADFGDLIRPYLKAFYNGARDMPGMQDLAKEMDGYDLVLSTDINTIGKEETKAEPKVEEAKAEKEEGAQTGKTTLGKVIADKDTRDNSDIWLVQPSERVSTSEFKSLKTKAKENNGYWSSFKKAFLFKNEQDANKFNNIDNGGKEQSDEPGRNSGSVQINDERRANTAAAVLEAGSVASEAEAIAEDEGRAAVTSTRASAAVSKVDRALDKVNSELALLGYYVADEVQKDFNEMYGYTRNAEKKAVKDANRLAKKLSFDLGVEVKAAAKANIAPIGGDIIFRLQLTDGSDLYVNISVEPNSYGHFQEDGGADDLGVGSIMYRAETGNNFGTNIFLPPYISYKDMLADIRSNMSDRLPEQPTTEDILKNAEIISQNSKKAKKTSQKERDSQEKPAYLQDGNDLMGNLFGDLFDNEDVQGKATETEPQAEPTKVASITPEENGLQGIYGVRSSGLRSDDSGHEGRLTEESGEIGERTGQDSGRTDGQGMGSGFGENRDSGSRLGHSVEDSTEQNSVETVSGSDDGSTAPASASETPTPKAKKKNTRNNSVARGVEYAPKTPSERFKANIEAIKLMKELTTEERPATRGEMEVLRKYTGWGGLGTFFNNRYSKEYRELSSILTPEELQSAEYSINTAYFTPSGIIDTLWDIAKRLGFKGGNILEGSAGIGNMLASMPKSISENSDISAVELDTITGNMLKLLYPDADVQIKGFQDADIENNSVDLAITNVPFGTDISVYDAKEKDITRKFGNRIHDFCIAKNIRKLREGGIGIFITTNGTLDRSRALRNWVVNEGNADFIGAFRLNNQTFGGTPVTSDILIVRKRVNGNKSPNAIDVNETSRTRSVEIKGEQEWNQKAREWITPTREVPMEYNSYFVQHPEYMAGEMKFGQEAGDTFRPSSVGLYPDEKKPQDKLLAKWAKQLQNSAKEETASVEGKAESESESTVGVKEGQIVVNSKGEICLSRRGKAVPIETNNNKVKGHTKEQVVKDYDALKTAINNVLYYQTKHSDDDGLKPLLDELNRAYDDFTSKYGNLNKNTALSFLRNDVDFPSVAALEDYKEDVNPDGKKEIKVSKTDIFNKRVVGFNEEPHPANVKDGVIVSINREGKINIPYIAGETGLSEEQVRKEVIASGLGFVDPATGKIEVRYEYLSGNVREKLEYAKEHNNNGEYDENIKALEKVIPADIPAHLINFTLGSDWIDGKFYTDYAKERFGLNDNFTPSNIGGVWGVPQYLSLGQTNEQNRAAGVISEKTGIMVMGHELMLAAMNNTPVRFAKTKKNFDGTTETITDPEATNAAQAKIEEMRQDFCDWAKEKIMKDNELAQKTSETYNRLFNAIVPKEIGDEFLPERFPGSTTQRTLYPHQKKAVIRGTTEPVLLAHEVGTGKSYTLISTAMELRRLGLAKKPMIVVQNATVGQFVGDAKLLYPNSKILTVSDADRTAAGRAAFYAKIKYNDWDMIVVPQSVFEMIPDSEERQRAFIQEKIDEKMHVIELAKQSGMDSRSVSSMEKELKNLRAEYEEGEVSKGNKRDAKKEAKTKENAAARAKQQLDRKTDDVSNFDEMGIDALLIDEAHAYKHLGFSTQMQRGVKGVDPSYSKRSAGVYLKLQSIFSRVGRRNVVFATGTPISNTAAEIWTFMKYLLSPDVMKANHIYYFDDFVRNFGRIAQTTEFTTSGKYKETTRFSGYINLPELVRTWSSVADTVLSKDAKDAKGKDFKDKLPEIEGGKAEDIFLPQSPSLVGIMNFVKAKLDEFDKMSGKEKREHSSIPLVMYGIAQRAAIDPRLVDRDAADEPLSKTNKAVEEILKDLKQTESYKGTCAVFCDNYRRLDATDSKDKVEGFNLFKEMKRKLVENGVPEEQIVIMESGMSVNKKQQIFDKVIDGDVRVIMGTTQTLGTGVNIQTRLHAVIHMDAPNRPMDYTQRNGRILRQGNLHKEWGKTVRIIRFGVEDSLDVTAYQRLKTKSEFIDAIMNGKPLLTNAMEGRTIEEPDEGLFDNAVAQLSGSQYAIKVSAAEREIRKLNSQKLQYEQDQIYIERQLRTNEAKILRFSDYVKDHEKALSLLKDTFKGGKVSKVSVEGKAYSNEESLNEALKEKITKPVREYLEENRKNYLFKDGMLSFNLSFDGIDATVNVLIKKIEDYSAGKGFMTRMSTEMTYNCPVLKIEGRKVAGNAIKEMVSDFRTEVATGKYSQHGIEALQNSIERMEHDNSLMRERRGKPFKDEEKLKDAQSKLQEYQKLMKEEMDAKEAKYANVATAGVHSDELNGEVNALLDSDGNSEEAEFEIENDEDYISLESAPEKQLAFDTVSQMLSDAGIVVEQLSDDAMREMAAARDSGSTGRIELLKDGDVVYGAAVGGKIFLNADRLNPNTPIHEYTHLWDKACKARNPELWKRGVELMKQTSLWKEVENDPNYAGLDEDGIAGEVHARLSGEHGAETLERLSKEAIDENGNLAESAMKASVIGRLRKWLSEFWHWVKDTMTPWSREEAEKVSIEDFINMPLADLAKGTKLNDNQYNSEERDIIDNAKKDGTFMKAPNGNPTNLNERQWVQVRTEAFKEWFGDWENDPENASKAVDENGEPKVLYHGGPYRFFRFDPARLGQSTDANSAREGFFFTDSQDLADVFAENSLKTLPEDDLDSLVEARINEMTGDELEDAYIAYRNEDDSYQDYIDETESPSDEDFLKGYNYDYGEGYKDGMSLDDARRAFLWNAIATKLYGGYFSDIEDIAEELSTVGVNLGNTEAVFLNLRTPAVDEVERDYFHDGEDIAPMTPTLKEAKENGRDGAIFTGITENGQEGPAFQYVVFNPNQIKSAVENSGKFSADNDDIRFSIVTDKDEIDRLNSKPTIKVYRAMQLVNGKLYPPMSGKVNGKWRDGIAVEDLGKVWEKADENPELADDKGRFTLNKGNGTTLKARYNPYIHTSTTPLNDQFSSAQSRPELVTVEVEIPKSELTSGYKADKAKDSVGKVEWKAGVVQGKLSGTRTVILSRWDKPVRIVPESEVADKIVEMFDGKDITMPSNVVTPALRAELERRGVPFVETDNQGKPTETTVRFREDGKSLFKAMQDNAEVLTPRQLTKEIWDKEVNGKTFNTPVGEVRLGSNQYVKNIKKGREKEFGMLIPTIERPDIIFEENAPEPGAERQTKYAFVKTFVDTNGERHLNYTSISVKKNDMEVVESSHFLRDKQVLNKIEKEHILWNRFASDSALSAQGGSIVQSNALSSRAKVGNEFEKTNESSENQQDIELDREGERSYDSVPTSLNHSESGKRYAAEETASAIGVKVEYISRDEMPKGHENAKGMWKDGKIYIALENHPDANDVRRTVLHEAVGHEGLRRLVGERNMNGFCMDVYKALPASERRKIADAALQRYGGDVYEATEEYLAELAEDMDTNKSYDTILDEIRVKTRNLLSKIGINIPLSRRDIRWILWQSYNANRQGDLINEAQRQVLADRLGFSLRADSLRAKAQEEIRLRSANGGNISAANIYNNAVARASKRLHESWVEMTNSVNTLVEAIEKQTGKAAKSFEDIRLALNQQSSKELAAIKAWERDFYNPMMSAIKEMMDAHRLKREEIDRYAFLKHGLERNDVFAKRDAKAYYQSRFEKNVKKINGDKRLSELEKKLKIADAEQVRDSYFADIDAGTDKMYLKFREKDYGGLTALFSTFSPISPQGENETDEEYNARVLASRKPQFATLAETEDAARAEVDAFEKRVGKASITKLWDATNKATKSILKHQYESNMISREQYTHVKDMFKYYVPMRGFADNTASDMYSYYASDKGSITPPLLRAKGRKTQAESPWGYIGAMASTAYAADFKNETKLALFYFISNRPDNDLVRISDVWYEKTSETDPDTGKPVFKQVYPEFKDGLNAAATRQEYDRWEADMEEKRKKGEAYKGTNGIDLQNSVIHIDEAQKNSHIIRFKVRGQEKMLLINGNPRAAQAINNELNIDAAQDGITKGAQKILRWMAGFNTSYNPEFWMSNAQRDLLFSIMATSIKESPEYTRQFIANLGRAVKVIGMFRKDKQGKLGSSYIEKMYKEFVDGGAVTGFTVIKDNEEWEQVGRQFTADRNKAGQAAMQALEAIQDFGEGIEQMTRFAAFLTARENGKSITEAVADAKELTVNFNRKGSGKGISWKESEKLKNRNGEKLNTAERVFYVGASMLSGYGRRFIMFFNASVQGLNTMYQLWTKDKRRTSAWMAGYFALGAINAMLHALLDDDDDYLDMPDYERRNNLLLGGKGNYFKWALPQESRVFYAMGDILVNDMILGRNPQKKTRGVGDILEAVGDIMPINPMNGLRDVVPQALVPAFENLQNEDYKGTKVYNEPRWLSEEEQKRTPKYTMAYSNTGRQFVLLSMGLNYISGGDSTDAGAIDIRPEKMEHLFEGLTGGLGTTLNRFWKSTGGLVIDSAIDANESGMNFGDAIRENASVRNTPFLNRLWVHNDDRYRNVHTSDVFNYYKAEAEHTQNLIRKAKKEGDADLLDRLYDDDKRMNILYIYRGYSGVMKAYDRMLKITDDKAERRQLIQEQDEYRKEMIQEIAEENK